MEGSFHTSTIWLHYVAIINGIVILELRLFLGTYDEIESKLIRASPMIKKWDLLAIYRSF